MPDPGGATGPAQPAADESNPGSDPLEILRSRRIIPVLVLAAIVGLVASGVAWGFLELIHQIQVWVFTDLVDDLGYSSAPLWYYGPILILAGVITAFAIARFPGRGGHIPAYGLNPTPVDPSALAGVVLAALASIGLGIVLGPEAPLIAIGSILGVLTVRLIRRDAPVELSTLIGVAGTFAAISFLFGSPLIAAVLLIEASGAGGPRLPLVLLPGLVAAGIGSLVSIGLGSWTGVSTASISIQAPPLPAFARPDLTDFLWTIALGAAVAIGTWLIFRIAREIAPRAERRPFRLAPVVGLGVALLAFCFTELTDKGLDDVLFSGQDQLSSLVSGAATWSLSALALLIAFKGLAYAISLSSFRGGPVFPAMFLGTAAGLMAAQLPGFELTPAVAVGIGAGVAAVLRLPLSAVVLATVLTSQAGLGAGPLIIIGVAVSYLVTLALPKLPEPPAEPASAAAG